MRAWAWMFSALAVTLAPALARADDRAPAARPLPWRERTRLCLLGSLGGSGTSVYGIPTGFIDGVIGVGVCHDGEQVGVEWYGTAGWSKGWTRAGLGANGWSVLGSRLAFRVHWLRIYGDLALFDYRFDPAEGLKASDGLDDFGVRFEGGVGVDLLRVFDPSHMSDIRATVAVDLFARQYSSWQSPGFGVAISAHL